jgi:hypothetical protein
VGKEECGGDDDDPGVQQEQDPEPIPQDFRLTTDADDLEGNDLDNLFEAKISQNQLGEQVNELGSGDAIDGGAGADTLYAKVQGASTAEGGAAGTINPETVNVETAHFEVRSGDVRTAEQVEIDAGDMLGVTEIGSVQSDDRLIISDLTTLPNSGDYTERRDTSDMTIRMDHTGNASATEIAADLEVYFDQNYIEADTGVTSTAEWFILDQDADEAGNAPLSAINVNGIRATVDGEEVTISDAAIGGQENSFDDHDAFVAELQDEVTALIDNGTLPAGSTLTVDQTSVDSTFLDNGEASSQIPAIVLTVPGADVQAIGFAQIEDAPGEYNVYGRLNSDSTETEELTETNIVLDKVGRGSDGGEIIVGGMSTNGENEFNGGSGSKGIHRFNVEVEGDATQPSDLAAMHSTNNTLEEVIVTAAEGAEASLTIGNINTDADGFAHVGVGVSTAQNGAVKDVRLFDASEFDNGVELHAHLSDEVVEKYLDITDDQEDPAEDNVAFQYLFGAGDDTLNMNLDKSNLAQAGTNTREDFTFAAETGAGDDTLELQIGDATGVTTDNWFINTVQNENLSVDAGAGDDDILTYGAGAFTIDAGAGNDRVRTDDSGATAADATDGKAVFVFNVDNDADDERLDDLESEPRMETLENVADTTVTVNFLGLEAEAQVGNTNRQEGGDVDDLIINQAIKDAINNDEYLSDLLVAEDGPSGALVVSALTDGDRELDDLDISFTSAVSNAQDANTVTALDTAALGTRYDTAFADDANGNNIDGVNSSQSANTNTVIDGTGEDTIILSTAEDANETVQLAADGEVDVIANFGDNDTFEFLDEDAQANFTTSVNNDGVTEVRVDDTLEALITDFDSGGAGGGGAGSATVAVQASDDGDTFDAAGQDTTFDVADGTFTFSITDFDSGDVLDFTDVGGNQTASFNVTVDADQADGEQQFQVTDAGGDIVTVNLEGLTAAQDAGLFNQASVDNVLGAGTLVI